MQPPVQRNHIIWSPEDREKTSLESFRKLDYLNFREVELVNALRHGWKG